LTKATALEYAMQGIRINAICPGFIRTAMLERVLNSHPGIEEALASRQPMRRIASPEEVAHAIIWLCSDAASFITGVLLPVDGGWTAL
jgi:NAD(P)-dependent dehydrogenase (short-subunit alcohol dehydrogenase family)